MGRNNFLAAHRRFSIVRGMKAHALSLLTLLALTLPSFAQGRLRVSSFSTILTEIAQQVGGDRVVVTGHVKPGVDPHEFTPTAADLKIISSSDIIVSKLLCGSPNMSCWRGERPKISVRIIVLLFIIVA